MLPCAQPGCSGHLDDGYCDTCGLAPQPVAEPAAPPPSPAPAPVAASAPTPQAPPAVEAPPSARPSTAKEPRAARRSGRTLARPVLPPQDPLSALVPGEVPPHRRLCSSCEQPLAFDRGFCPHCKQENSFVPTLRPGELLAGKYEIKGTLAFGGLGWIYLALDVVLGRWVTLKGLLNAHDPKLLEVAALEREYLASVKHPNIVSIYDFLTHGREGFIVMEYVNGKSLAALRREAGAPLPASEALAYLVEALPALSYLHEQGLIYCDFKPDNVMVEQDTVKLIDLGAVRRIDEAGGDIYGSRGYSAPEAAEHPSLRSDLYSVGRTLAVLVAAFDFQRQHEFSLPEGADALGPPPLLDLLRKATRHEPERRFASAIEMREQMLGVLRMLAGPNPALGPSQSRHFDLELPSAEAPEQATALSRLRLDEADEGASLAAAAAAVGEAPRRRDLLLKALRLHPRSVELKLRLIDEHLTLSEWDEATRRLDEVAGTGWRSRWYHGRKLLLEGKGKAAFEAFRQVAAELPGELGPRLAMACTCESTGEHAQAVELYEQVSRAEPALAAAAFALARCHQRLGQRSQAAAALGRLPPSSPHFVRAQLALARLLLDAPPAPDDVLAAAEIIEALEGLGGPVDVALSRADALAAAARLAAQGEVRGGKVLGVFFEERALRLAAEQSYRRCAKLVDEPALRALLVDEANAIRPRSLF